MRLGCCLLLTTPGPGCRGLLRLLTAPGTGRRRGGLFLGAARGQGNNQSGDQQGATAEATVLAGIGDSVLVADGPLSQLRLKLIPGMIRLALPESVPCT